jgi:Hemerythrin HHE cation binding domain
MADTIFEALRESHETQRALVRKLQRSVPGAARDELFTALRIELAAHEASEERFLYCAIMMDDMGLHASRHALADHHEMDALVEKLQQRGKGSPAWMPTFKQLSAELLDHLKEEEKAFFQISGKILTEKQKSSLAKKYRLDFERMKKKLASASS